MDKADTILNIIYIITIIISISLIYFDKIKTDRNDRIGIYFIGLIPVINLLIIFVGITELVEEYQKKKKQKQGYIKSLFN